MPSVTVFTDLDDSLLQTQEKARTRASGRALTPAAMDRNGAPSSFHAPDQLALLHLFDQTTLVPVTGRNREALDRVSSPRFADYRIVSHGALIYTPAGEPLKSWYQRVAGEAVDVHNSMQTLVRVVGLRLGPEVPGLRARVIEDAGMPVYMSLKADEDFAPALLDEVTALARTFGNTWTVHCNGRNIAVLPPYASKAAAVAKVMEIKRKADPDAIFVGVGDSLTDLPYLKLCDFAVVPRHSQIQESWP